MGDLVAVRDIQTFSIVGKLWWGLGEVLPWPPTTHLGYKTEAAIWTQNPKASNELQDVRDRVPAPIQQFRLYAILTISIHVNDSLHIRIQTADFGLFC